MRDYEKPAMPIPPEEGGNVHGHPFPGLTKLEYAAIHLSEEAVKSWLKYEQECGRTVQEQSIDGITRYDMTVIRVMAAKALLNVV